MKKTANDTDKLVAAQLAAAIFTKKSDSNVRASRIVTSDSNSIVQIYNEILDQLVEQKPEPPEASSYEPMPVG